MRKITITKKPDNYENDNENDNDNDLSQKNVRRNKKIKRMKIKLIIS